MKKFATIRPKRVQLNGTVDETVTQTVAIIPEKEYPFTITATTARKGDAIDFELSEKPADTGSGYELMVTNRRQSTGRYQDIITLKTDNPLKPELQIRVYGNIRAPKSDEKPKSEADAPQSGNN